MKILIIPDSFKGCLSAKQVANAIEKGIFTEEVTDPLWAFVGDWMYMHSDKSKKIDYFKNKWSRKYKEVSYA